jgi:tetratricopeptide (TPR) repeat protein
LGPIYYAVLGDVYFAADSLAEAKQAYTKAATLDENYSPARYGLARVAAKNRETEVAVKLLKQCLATKPYPKEYVQEDPAFEGIRDDKRFKSVIRDVY